MSKKHVPVLVVDRTILGYAIRPTQTKVCRGFIIIAKDQTWKQKLMVLAHEIGHLYNITEQSTTRKGAYKWSPTSCEWKANRRAAKLLGRIGPRLVKDFSIYYSSVRDKRKNNERKKIQNKKS